MQISVSVAHEDEAGRNYLTWAPIHGSIQLLDAGDGPADQPVTVTLSNENPDTGGQLEFAAARDDLRAGTLDVVLPADGTPVDFWVAGVLGKPSIRDGDAVLQVSAAEPGPGQPGLGQPGDGQPGDGPAGVLLAKPMMVRIRKDANQLTPAERDRFLTALAKLNDRGAGLFKDFREMHRIQIALNQAHGAPGFLSWHRAYLLDLERELQLIDPSVALPYWRFDQPAPNIFSPDFMGSSGAFGTLNFSAGNLLRQWQTDGAPGISRRPLFTTSTEGAFVSDEPTTLTLGGATPNAVFDTGTGTGGFDEMEGDPHGFAHTSFNGYLRSPGTAPRDPLFFLLHCNVDRLWARWQWFNGRFDGTTPNTYFFRGSATSSPATRIGHNLLDTMWPWNNVTGGPRPPNAPRTPFPAVPSASAPGGAPTVGEMIDYQGLLDPAAFMNFAYDDVPYGPAS